MVRYSTFVLAGSLLFLVLPSRSPAQPPQKLVQLRLDADGLPLPAGAIARLGHFDYVASVAFSPTGDHLLTGSPEKGLLLWETKKPRLVRQYPFPAPEEGEKGENEERPLEKANLMRASFTPDGKTVVALVSGGELQRWETITGKALKWPGKRKGSLTYAFSPNGKMVALVGEDGMLRLIHPQTGRPLWNVLLAKPVTWEGRDGKITLPQQPHYLAFSQDNRTLLMAGTQQKSWNWNNAVVRKIETQTGLERLRFQQNIPGEWLPEQGADLMASLNQEILGMAVSPDHQEAAIARYGSVKLLNLSKRPGVRVLDGLGVVTPTVVFSADGQWLLAGRCDGGLRVWDVGTATVLRDLPAHTEAITALAFSPDGRLLASGSEDRTVLLWEWAELRKRIVANPKVK